MMSTRPAVRRLVVAAALLLAGGCLWRARAQSPPAQPAPLPAVVTGVVVDTAGVPIPHAVVSVVGLPLRTRVDSAGRFRLEAVPPGLRIFAVRALGYRPLMWTLTLAPGQSAHGRIGLKQFETAIVLPELTVVGDQYVPARIAGFYQRRQLGFGHYLDREAIEKRNASDLTDLLLGVAGVRVYQDPGDPTKRQVAFLRCGRIGVYVDGFRLWGDVGENLRLVNPSDVEAIEIYKGAGELPAEFMSDDCAAIVIWTRY